MNRVGLCVGWLWCTLVVAVSSPGVNLFLVYDFNGPWFLVVVFEFLV